MTKVQSEYFDAGIQGLEFQAIFNQKNIQAEVMVVHLMLE